MGKVIDPTTNARSRPGSRLARFGTGLFIYNGFDLDDFGQEVGRWAQAVAERVGAGLNLTSCPSPAAGRHRGHAAAATNDLEPDADTPYGDRHRH
jgi:hypothetical protein